MGSPKFPRKKYDTPLHPWKEDRIKSERELIKKYGLKNHKEVWKAKTYLGKYREHARELLAKIGGKNPQVKKESDQLLLHLTRMGILPAGSSLDDVLALETESILSRRLQILVYLKGLSSTVDHSRQLISHGHITIGNKKVTIPSYIVTKDEEKDIGYTNKSPLNELSHPARPKTDVYKTVVSPPKKGEIETAEPKQEEKPESKLKEEETEKKREVEEKTTEPAKEEEKLAEKPEEEVAEKPESKEKPAEEKKKGETVEKPAVEESPEESVEKPVDEKKEEESTEKSEQKEEVPEKPESEEKPAEGKKKDEPVEKPTVEEKPEESAEKPVDETKEEKSIGKPEGEEKPKEKKEEGDE